MPYAFEDIPGQEIPEAHELPGVDPLSQALAALRAVTAPSPDQVVGDSLQAPPVAPNVLDMSQPVTGQGTVAPVQAPNRPDFAVGVDRIGAELGTPDLAGTAGFDPNANIYTPPGVPHSVDEATRQQNDQLARAGAARERYDQAALAARQAQGDRLAKASEDAAEEQALLNTAQERATAAIHARADAETAAWLTELTAKSKEEPNPGRWFDEMSGLGKALWGLSLVFGAGYAAITPGARNAALDMVRQEMAADVARQEKRLQNELATLREKGATLREKQARNLSDVRDKYARQLTRLQALERAWIARASVPGDQDALAAKAASQAWFEEQKLPIIAAYREEKVRAAEAQKAREFAAAQAASQRAFQEKQDKLSRDFQAEQKALDRQLQRDLAPVSVSASYRPGGPNPTGKDGLPLLSVLQSGKGAPAAGVVVKGPGGSLANGTGEMRFRDEKKMQEAGEIVSKANTRYTAMSNLVKYLKSQDGASALAQLGLGTVDPTLNSLMTQLGYETAKAHDARITNQDFSKGSAQAMGFDANGNWLDRAKFYANRDGIIAKLEKDLGSMPEVVTNSIRPLNDAAINGQGTEAVWDPNLLNAPTVPERSQLDVEGGQPVTLDQKPVTSAKDYLTRAQAESADPNRRGQELPDHDAAAVQSVIEGTKGRGPDGVAAEASRVLKTIETRMGELAGVQRPDAWRGEPARDLTPDEQAEYARLGNTYRIVLAIEKDAVKKAADTVKKVEAHVNQLRNVERTSGRSWVTPDVIRNVARERYGLDRAPKEVDELVRKLSKVK